MRDQDLPASKEIDEGTHSDWTEVERNIVELNSKDRADIVTQHNWLHAGLR